LDNFALYRHDGVVWEFKRHRRGRLVLLDFWHTTCPPCLASIRHLNALQRAYGSYGLEVVGIACESGTRAQQRAQVAQARVRYSMAYTTLLSGGGAGPCPVRTQFEIKAFPTLVLVDEAGNIVWRSEGLDEYRLADLKGQIQRRLGLPGE
jgi:thiol-disulfide isomerase/thioredoxin